MRFQELDIPFPATDVVWNASSNWEWAKGMTQEPPSRTSASFSTLCSLALSPLSASKRLHLPGFFTVADFELGMCSIQSRLWEETKKFQIAGHSVLVESELTCEQIASQHGYGQSWPFILEIWRVTREHISASSHAYSSPSAEQDAYLTGTLWYHASMLRAYADISLFRHFAFRLQKAEKDISLKSTPFTRHYELAVHQWSRSSIARDALWHAAQILHSAINSTPKLRRQSSLPLLVVSECLFRAALVIWAVARSNFICSMCAPVSSITHGDLFLRLKTCPQTSERSCLNNNSELRPLELTNLAKHSEEYNKWVNGERHTSLQGTSVCACNVPSLIDRYMQAIRDLQGSHIMDSTTTLLSVMEALKRNR